MKRINNSKFILYILLGVFFILSSCKVEPPKQSVVEDAKTRVDQILDSLRLEQNIIINAKKTEEYFDDQKNQYVINYDIETGLDSTAIIDSEASMFLQYKNNKWHYNFVFDESYRGSIQ